MYENWARTKTGQHTVTCTQTTYIMYMHQPKCHESQTQAVDRYGTFSMKAIRIEGNYLKILLTFLNLTELALNEFLWRDSTDTSPRGVVRGYSWKTKANDEKAGVL